MLFILKNTESSLIPKCKYLENLPSLTSHIDIATWGPGVRQGHHTGSGVLDFVQGLGSLPNQPSNGSLGKVYSVSSHPCGGSSRNVAVLLFIEIQWWILCWQLYFPGLNSHRTFHVPVLVLHNTWTIELFYKNLSKVLFISFFIIFHKKMYFLLATLFPK